jgi:RHH-type proline utilization regulon transcriptional repressor/proline dehydrogenase/delta 1-pyrroline-5-carboxylate dehydrogenase
VFPQFATHNAHTLATIHAMAGADFHPGRYEFQCLHGMGEPLYEEVVGPGKLDRPCRIYAPVGTHETLLAYLVRRLLENGANSSFVNRIGDPSVPVEALVADPVEAARAIEPIGAPHPRIALPRALFGPDRPNSAGLDLSSEGRLAALGAGLAESLRADWTRATGPRDAGRRPAARAQPRPRPGRGRAGAGAGAGRGRSGARRGRAARAGLAAVPAGERAARLRRAADAMEAAAARPGRAHRARGRQVLRQRGRRGREAVDFCDYYAAEAERSLAARTRARRSGRSSALSPGTSRSPSSRGRSRPRWRPATRCWPSRPRRPR